MRIKYSYSIDDKVEIIVDTTYKFQEIACLVDSPIFIKETRLIKQRLGIRQPIIDLNATFTDIFSNWQKIYSEWSDKNKVDAKTLEYWAKRILRKLNSPLYLKEIVIQAILLNMVTNYTGIIKILNSNSRIDEETIVIVPTPHTTVNEIKEALGEAKKLMKLRPSLYKKEKEQDTTPNIRQYRDWYWKHVLGMTFEQIKNEWNDKNKAQIDYDDVGKAIDKYKKMLL